MKKVVSILLAMITTVSLYSCGDSTDPPSITPSTPSDTVENSQQNDTEDVPQGSALAQDEPDPDETIGPITEASLDDLCDIIKLVSEDNYEEFDVFNDGENVITMNIWQDGLAVELGQAMDANDESVKQLWETLRENMIDVCNSTCDLIDAAGREDVSFLLNVLNDLNHENVLLSITDGVVICDVMEEYSPASATAAPSVSQTDAATASQKSALSQAKSYLRVSAFSYEGLVDQLEYEKYTAEQAAHAADNCGADWDEQAVKKAESYLSIMSFSRDSLINQLEYDGFTHAQAVYGAEQNGY